MKSFIVKVKQNPGIMALPVILLLCFTLGCQEEETPLAATSKTYEELSAEMKSLSGELKIMVKQYPDFKIDQQHEKANSVNKYERGISGVENSADKRKIATLYYQIHELREKMFGLPDATGTYTSVEDQPSPEGSLKEFYAYISKNLKYPAEARQKGIEGKVFVEFVVAADGSITEVKTLKGIGAGCDKEAERVLKNAAAWNPGRHNGEPVKVRMVLPVTYRL